MRRLLLICLTTAVILMGSLIPAKAHDALIGTTPADGSVAKAPTQVVLRFSEPAQTLGTQVAVTDADGAQWGSGQVTLDGKSVIQKLRTPVKAGDYTVRWRATSADGHVVSGTFNFAVPPSAVATPIATASPLATATSPAATTAAAGPAADGGSGIGTTGGWAIGLLTLIAAAAGAVVWQRRRGSAGGSTDR